MVVQTKWPILVFFFQIYKLSILVDIFRDAPENRSYEYVAFVITWQYKTLFKLKLYDTAIRSLERKYNEKSV